MTRLVERTVPDDLAGDRLDRVVAVLGGMSRSVSRDLVTAGAVTCDGVVILQPRHPVAAGVVVAFTPPPEPEGLVAAPVPFGIAYEDAHLAVVDKPAGVVTHPGAGDTGPTLAAGILHRWPAVRGVGDPDRWGIVHRLDRDTSGLLVVALTAEANSGLRAAIKERRVTREYLALVAGDPEIPTGTVEAPLARDPRRPSRMRIDPHGRSARTHYRVAEALGRHALLAVTLDTGRTHQIRVHLASIGLPVCGDRTYGVAAGSPRLFLHAARLALSHPITGETIDVTSPLPDDLSDRKSVV